MGLIEQIRSGSVFSRGTVNLSNSPISGSTMEFGATYILLGIKRTTPTNTCRVRLYGDSASLSIDVPRTTSSFDYSASVALNLDTWFSPNTRSITFNPPILATSYDTESIKTYYHIESTNNETISINYYPIEFNTGSRTGYQTTVTTLTSGQKVTGNITTAKSFIILQSFSNYDNTRLRLYSRPITDISITEQNRDYTASVAGGAHLIADMLFDSASYTYKMTPILQAYNLETYKVGNNRVGYIFENLSGSSITNAFAAIIVYPVED